MASCLVVHLNPSASGALDGVGIMTRNSERDSRSRQKRKHRDIFTIASPNTVHPQPKFVQGSIHGTGKDRQVTIVEAFKPTQFTIMIDNSGIVGLGRRGV